MPYSPLHIPSYRQHKASGQAVVTIAGKDHYLGSFGTPASHCLYDQLIQEWLAANRKINPEHREAAQEGGLTIDALAVAYWSFAESYYLKDGQPTGELQAIRYSLRPLTQLYGATPCSEFGPVRLKAVRQAMVDQGLARSLINKRVNRIRQLFKWGIENELVP
ncbi:MAG: hypothetical protein OER86_13980, partial [Phycisphaerae bacterium]|nr:hypothetical protein [Phycisphaerae bacterium]